MQWDPSCGARPRGAPAPGRSRRVGSSRSPLAIALLWLAAGPATAPAAGLDPTASAPAVRPTPVLAALGEPCSSARAVHDLRCPNYTGFTTRLGGSDTTRSADGEGGDAASGAVADAPAAARPQGLAPEAGEPLGLKPGRDLQRGVASWYGPGFHGRPTANGERFDMNELTAAHKTLPFGTRVVVHNPRTGKDVVVRINDRGPFTKNRMIDLSKAAARALGLGARGHDTVVLRQLGERS